MLGRAFPSETTKSPLSCGPAHGFSGSIVVEQLKKRSRQGRRIVLGDQQPGLAIFDCFDNTSGPAGDDRSTRGHGLHGRYAEAFIPYRRKSKYVRVAIKIHE